MLRRKRKGETNFLSGPKGSLIEKTNHWGGGSVIATVEKESTLVEQERGKGKPWSGYG